VQGLMDVLRARAEFRNQFRLPVTRVQMAQNNPLKFAINAEDALTALLRTRARGYLPPREAFDDAFDDVRFHQLAMLAGMRAGFESMMNRFDPKKLQQQADRRSHGFWARFGAKQRYWDRYVDQFEQMAGNADSVFQRLYGEEFSGAYERQLEELKRTRVKSAP
jgi:type VI secretion system protein ImpI